MKMVTSAIISLLKTCTSSRHRRKGLLLHQRAVVIGVSFDPYVATSLITFYSCLRDCSPALILFNEMPERSLVSWTAIIGCSSRSGNINLAFSMFDAMRMDGVHPTPVTLLGLLAGVSDMRRLSSVHASAITFCFISHLPLLNSFLNLYCRCSRFDSAVKLFESMEIRDVVSWNSIISGYSRVGNVRETFALFQRMDAEGVNPDLQTFLFLLPVAGICGNPRIGRLIHGKSLVGGFRFDVQSETALFLMYLKSGFLEYGFIVFERISDKDDVSWTAMVSGLVQIGNPNMAVLVFQRMIRFGFLPSTSTMASAISACGQLVSLTMGSSIHGYSIRHGMMMDVPMENSLITMYAKCGSLRRGFTLFDRMSDRDAVSWNSMVCGCVSNGLLTGAFSFFAEMVRALQKPDDITVVALMQACASKGALCWGKCVHGYVVRNGLRPLVAVDTALVDMYHKCGNLVCAQRCFDLLQRPDPVSWSALIMGYGDHGKGEVALEKFRNFLDTGFRPNDVVFLSALSACSHNGLVREGMDLFCSMTVDFMIKPGIEHCGCVVDLLCRAGKVKEAFEFFKKQVTEPTVEVLGMLLDACRSVDDDELREAIAGEILAMEPVNAEAYVQLAHSYASVSSWDGVTHAWNRIKSLGVKKLPGWSFIEIQGIITTFFMWHTSHPRSDEIISILKLFGSENLMDSQNIIDEEEELVWLL